MSGDLCADIGGGAEVRPARQDEIHAAAQLVADSFAPVEPYVAWLFPHAADRAALLLPLAEQWATDAWQAGTLMVVTHPTGSGENAHEGAAHLAGVAIWSVEGADHSTEVAYPRVTDLLGSLARQWKLLGKNIWRYYYEALLAKAARGWAPQCYLSSLAIAPEYRGRGFAAALLRHPPRPDLPLTLECREELVGFYAHHGFLPGRSYRLPRTATMVSCHRTIK